MSYPWTRVPGDKPPTDAAQLRLLPLADLVMALLWSRPGGISLRTTWVTPATIGLGAIIAGLAALSGLAAITAALLDRALLLGLGGIFLFLVAIGSGSVALYGVRQRLIGDGTSVQRR